MQDHPIEIRCSIEHVYHLVQLCCVEVLDGPDAEAIRSRILDLIEDEECPRVAIDLNGMALVCTAAWGKFMVLQQRLSRDGGTLAVVNVHETVKEALRSMKLDRLINICDSVDALAEDVAAVPLEVAADDGEPEEEIAFDEAEDEVAFEETGDENEGDDIVVFGEADDVDIVEDAGDEDEAKEA